MDRTGRSITHMPPRVRPFAETHRARSGNQEQREILLSTPLSNTLPAQHNEPEPGEGYLQRNDVSSGDQPPPYTRAHADLTHRFEIAKWLKTEFEKLRDELTENHVEVPENWHFRV